MTKDIIIRKDSKNKRGESLKLSDIKYPSGIKLFIEYAVNNYKMFDYKEICFAFFYFSRTEMETYKEIIKNIIKKDNNKKITLYYNQKFPLIGYDIKFENSDMKEITTNNYLILKDYMKDGFSADMIIYAINLALKQNKRNLAYIEGILKNWELNNIKTLGNAKQENENHYKEKTKTEEKVEYEEVQFENEEEYRKKLYEKQKG